MRFTLPPFRGKVIQESDDMRIDGLLEKIWQRWFSNFVMSLTDALNAITTDVAALQAAIAALQISVATIQAQITVIQAQIVAIQAAIAGLSTPVQNEVPGGAINGVNVTFTLVNVPNAGSLVLRVRGIEQELGADYTLVGLTITMVIPPLAGSYMRASYTH